MLDVGFDVGRSSASVLRCDAYRLPVAVIKGHEAIGDLVLRD